MPKKDNLPDKLVQVKEEVDLYLTATLEARLLSEKDRDYIDGYQWTAEEESKLRSRGQAPIVINRCKPKHQGLVGLWDLRRSDPKAYPRTKKHEKSANAITDGLRYVVDNVNFNNNARLDVADNFFCEGTAGAIVDVKERKNGKLDIRVQHIPWDRIYYDPYSTRHDFSDARFKGIVMWMDFDQFTSAFPDYDPKDLIDTDDNTDETFSDKPRWIDPKRKRIRVCDHYYLEDGIWYHCYFTTGAFLVEPTPSEYLDEDGEPDCPIEIVCGNIDRNGNRYGEARSYISAQDEINHRRSKFLHLLSQRQTFGRKGQVKDIMALKRELAKPNGHVEFIGDQFGKDFGVLPTGDMAQGQVELYQDAKAELDSVGFNAQLSGERQSGDLSGKAIDRLQQAGTIELNRQYTLLAGWEKRIYRQIWFRMKQFWTEEKWIRVTDDQDNLRWVGLNGQVKLQEWMEEIINDESESLVKRKKVAASYQAFQAILNGDDIEKAQQAETILNQIVGISNPVPEIDVDIIIEQSFDSVNIQQEQFEMLARFAQNSDIDIIELIELSQLRGKEGLIEKIEKRRQAQAQAQGGAQQLQMQEAQAKTAKIAADAQMSSQKAIQTRIENELLITQPDRVTQVSV